MTLLFSCNSYKYLGDSVPTLSNQTDCEIQVFFLKPSFEYKQIGECKSKGFSFSGDGAKQAIKQLKKCACKYGGDGILVTKASDRELTTYNASGYNLSSSDVGVKFSGFIIKKK